MTSFVTGLLLGQLSVIILVACVLRFFLFAESPRVHSRKSSKQHSTSIKVHPETSASLASILEHIYYDVDSHPAESMDWFTVLVAMHLNALRTDAVANDNMLNFLNKVFQNEKIPSFVDKIKIVELDLGSDYPLFHNCRIVKSVDSEFSDGIEAQLEIDLKDRITLGVETQLALNYPKAMVAYLPVRASVSLVNFSGGVALSMKTIKGETYVTLQFSEGSVMEFDVQSIIGARSQLENVPKIGDLVRNVIQGQFNDALVYPNFLKFKVPSLWSVKRKVE